MFLKLCIGVGLFMGNIGEIKKSANISSILQKSANRPAVTNNTVDVSQLLANPDLLKNQEKQNKKDDKKNDFHKGKLKEDHVKKSFLDNIQNAILRLFGFSSKKTNDKVLKNFTQDLSSMQFLTQAGYSLSSSTLIDGAQYYKNLGVETITNGLQKMQDAKTDRETNKALKEVANGIVVSSISDRVLRKGQLDDIEAKQNKVYATALFNDAKRAVEQVQQKYEKVQPAYQEAYVTMYAINDNIQKAQQLHSKIEQMYKDKNSAQIIKSAQSRNMIQCIADANVSSVTDLESSLNTVKDSIEKSSNIKDTSETYLSATNEAKCAKNAHQFRDITKATSLEAQSVAQGAIAQLENAVSSVSELKKQLAISNAEIAKMESMLKIC